jgi:hypothetical protein
MLKNDQAAVVVAKAHLSICCSADGHTLWDAVVNAIVTCVASPAGIAFVRVNRYRWREELLSVQADEIEPIPFWLRIVMG